MKKQSDGLHLALAIGAAIFMIVAAHLFYENVRLKLELSKMEYIQSVRTIQTRLKELGYYEGEIDCDYGRGTKAAHEKYLNDRDAVRNVGLAGGINYNED